MNKINGPMVDINTIPNIICSKCNNDNFIQSFKLKKISKLQTQSGQDELTAIPIFICSSCKTKLEL